MAGGTVHQPEEHLMTPDPKMFSLLMAAIGGRATLIGYIKGRWQVGTPDGGSPPEELSGILDAHHERLRALLDAPVLLNVDWNSGDTEATISIIPADGNGGNERFKTFTLPF